MGATAIVGASTCNGGKGPRDRPARPRPPYAVAPGVSSEARAARGEQAGHERGASRRLKNQMPRNVSGGPRWPPEGLDAAASPLVRRVPADGKTL